MDHDQMGAEKKRRAQRFPMAYPVKLKSHSDISSNGRTARVTRDISSIGVYFEYDSSMEVGSPVEFVLTLAQAIPGGKPLLLHCRGKVVRVDRNSASNTIGFAVTVDEWN